MLAPSYAEKIGFSEQHTATKGYLVAKIVFPLCLITMVKRLDLCHLRTLQDPRSSSSCGVVF